MKKILVINDIAQGGGVEKLMYDLVMYWKDTYHITIATGIKDPDFYNIFPTVIEYKQYSIKRTFAGIRKLRHWGNFKKKIRFFFFRNTVKKEGYDVILAMKEGNITRLVSKLSAPVKLAWVHLDYHNAYWTKSVFKNAENELQCMKTFQNILCVSDYIKSSIQSVIGDPGNLLTMYNPIPVEQILNASLEEVTDMKKPEDKVLFVTIGRLHYQKGYDWLMEACKRLEQENLNFEVWVIGEGEETEKLFQIRDSLGLETLHFLGLKSNPYKYLKLADWFISTSRYEGYSIVSQEAVVLGIPIIATECSGVRELLGDKGEYGIIINHSVDSIYEAMKRVILSNELHQKYKDAIHVRKDIIGYEERIDAISKLFYQK